jgi:hypothetical protein
MTALCSQLFNVSAKVRNEKLTITPNFLGRQLSLTDTIELKLDREIEKEDGRLAVFFGDVDITSLFSLKERSLSYVPKSPLLPPGESTIKVFLVAPISTWNPVAELPITLASKAQVDVPGAPEASETIAASKRAEYEFTPNVSINMKGQKQMLTFPLDAVPERNPYGEVDGQASVQMKISKRGWTLNNKFDFVGVGFQKNALRFGELQNDAPKIDLSSYLVELNKGRFAVRLGHVSFGSNRHLINSFSSRGLTVTVPISQRNDLTFLAANGTSVVGHDNFLGVSRRRHSVLGATLAHEFFEKKPGALRLEITGMRGSLLPLTNFNQREVNDAEKSIGLGFRIVGNAFKERLRYEAGYTRSRFHNPSDPQIEQGNNLTPIHSTTKGARYGEVSFDFIDGMKLWDDRKLKVTGTFRHEEIEPLFRSVVASTQADRRQNQFEISALLGDLNFSYSNLGDNDNLARIASILRSITRRNNFVFGVALGSFLAPAKPKTWLPRISYVSDLVHQFGTAFPNGGLFTSASQIPDQESRSKAFTAQWQLSEKLTFGYRYNKAFQDNKQPGRELADFESAVSGVSVGTNLLKTLNISFELTRETQRAFEQPRIDRTLRVGTQATWQTPFLKNSTLSGNISTTIAGDAEGLNKKRNAEFDVQWAYRFVFGKEKFKKLEAQFFIRYGNRYGDAFDRIAVIRSFTKTQGFNAGITFNVF